MTFDFSKIKPRKKEALPVDPIELFQKLKISDPGINDLWLAQGDALRKWHDNRLKDDVGIILNTGAGKTLVGLLIAQSLVNETRNKVLYACSSIQLVEQTAEKARGYGIDVSTYFHGEFSSDLYNRCEAACITTYQALFNGKSRFFQEDLSAIIFDDAHAAEHLLRDQFSLHIDRNSFPNVYSELLALFKDYHEKCGKSVSYAELRNPASQHLILIPPFEIGLQRSELLRILHDANLDKQNTIFAWEHIKDHVDTCCVLISGADISITPPFVPVLSLPYFQKGRRRVYLSATLATSDAFARTFGKVPDDVVTPSTTAGECERLVIIPSQIGSDQDDTEIAKQLISGKKALVLVPTYERAAKWQDMVTPPLRKQVTQAVRKFKSDVGTPKLLLAARYDGVDFPGDTCRVMVIDDLPMGVGPLERYMWKQLGLANTLRTVIASRIVQSFGRISRGMSDHGVVVLTGRRLVDWMLVPKNRSVLPPFLQKQITLGDAVSKQADDTEGLAAAARQCLIRDKNWIAAYNEFMASERLEDSDINTDLLTRLSKSEAEYGLFMWQREYQNAAKVLASTLKDAFSLSSSTGAWHCMWLGAAYLFLGDDDTAQEMFVRAHANQKNIPAYPRKAKTKKDNEIPQQIIEVDQQIKIFSDGTINMPKTLNADLAHLDGTGTSRQTEEALRALGQYLGLEATRPDKEFCTGPDVLWISEGMPALCMEVKTGKNSTSRYQKKETSQLSDHVQWVKDNNIGVQEIVPVFVGPIVGVTDNANPLDEYLVIELEQFRDLAEQLKAAIADAVQEALPLTLRDTLFKVFSKRDLIWPNCLDTLEKTRLRDL